MERDSRWMVSSCNCNCNCIHVAIEIITNTATRTLIKLHKFCFSSRLNDIFHFLIKLCHVYRRKSRRSDPTATRNWVVPWSSRSLQRWAEAESRLQARKLLGWEICKYLLNFWAYLFVRLVNLCMPGCAVRESDRKPGSYVLSYLGGKTGINHFRWVAWRNY